MKIVSRFKLLRLMNFKPQERYFNRGHKLFWLFLLLIFLLAILHLADPIYDGNEIPRLIVELENQEMQEEEWQEEKEWLEEIKLEEDNSPSNPEPVLYLNWDWIDFDGESHSIKFSHTLGDLAASTQNRKNNFNYGPLYQHDRHLLKDLIGKMKVEIKNRNLNYLNAIEYVCSSIQYIPYTLVLSSDYLSCPCELNFVSFSAYCRVQPNGRGCCDGVDPFGVFAPFEFVYKKTGDCDTRSLLAFTLLKEMGFDVAVMVSKSQMHSVLGIHMPNNNGFSVGRNSFGKKFVLWELTSLTWRLGMNVDGNDWLAAME
jgi:hypothetical protein